MIASSMLDTHIEHNSQLRYTGVGLLQDGTTNAAIQRAYHVDEKKARPDLKIDIKYYLSQQIHPVVTRLCDPIDGIDAIQIAESLGMSLCFKLDGADRWDARWY